jgi:C_GCAxxG_C_C family probable redox protein
MHRVEKTVDLHKNGGLNCSQAILTTFGESFGMDREMAKLLGRPWGGGMGHLGMTCGYLTGAVLVLAQAINNKDELQARRDSFKAVQELFRRFQERHGTFLCKELLGADFSTKEGTKKIREEQLIAKHCYEYGKDVAEILEELL